jgi:two-component system NtrC family sensor kinase
MTGVLTDITAKKKMEEQLLQTEKLSSLGGILSGVAHELNNPLTTIIGNAQLLSRVNIDAEIKQKLDIIYQESFRCTKIVGGLLAFAREPKPERVLTDINRVIMEVYKLREYELRVDDVSLKTELDETIPEISVDPHQIQQVLINLINNAYHALLDQGGGSVMIKSRQEQDTIIIECIDDGPGIPDEIKRKIFDPFFTTKEVGMGTGLGLSICYGIIKEHDGSIEVESHPGFGTRFIVSLPRNLDVTFEDEGAPPQFIPKPGWAEKVLVVEDEASLRRFISDALVENGYTVVSSESAVRAVEILKDEEFDVIVSDMKMPGMSGQNFYTYVQKYYPDLAQRMVFVTGDVLGKETQNFFQTTGCQYVEKPFNIDELMGVLGKLLGDEKVGR